MKYLCLLIAFLNFCSLPAQEQTPITEILNELKELPEQASLTSEGSQNISLDGNYQIYKVKKGDNPWTIARRFKVEYERFLKINEIDNPKGLQIGQKLKIPKKQLTSDSEAASVTANNQTSNEDYYYYTMKSGEDPWILSRKLKVSYVELLEFNQIDDPRTVKTGRKLKIPK